MIKTCVVIGSGNVATHLATALAPYVEILQIFSRDILHARELADRISSSCVATNDVTAISPDADLYLISVTDDCIASLLQQIQCLNNGIWVHTSGSVGVDIFAELRGHFGVFYPLQTFSKHKAVEMKSVPFFIEGSSSSVENSLLDLAGKISDNVRLLNSEGRRRLHVAAVFACNFVNYMWVVADRQLRLCGTDIHALDPLLKETMEKIAALSPAEAQTGPARRGDKHIIDSHIKMLSGDDAQLYELLSNQIYKTYHEQN